MRSSVATLQGLCLQEITCLSKGTMKVGDLHYKKKKCSLPSSGSMGKLVNPFASHAKDPQFEPGWNHFIEFFCCSYQPALYCHTALELLYAATQITDYTLELLCAVHWQGNKGSINNG
jgi:hypothetical protein